MNDLEREKRKGLSFPYLLKVVFKRLLVGKKYQTPGFGLAGQLFGTVAKEVVRRLGPEEGEKLLRAAVEEFGRERGRRIAEAVKAKGKSLSLRNWLIYTDISPDNFPAKPSFPEGDLVACVGDCSFMRAAGRWGLTEYAKIYCKYADYAILGGYNPDVTLILEDRHATGRDFCRFQYIMKEENKRR
ncbi:MAG: L-2-amino-thiazoline-4-carboxylic acid hydrolase [Spirochaetes bacterium]|nr:L-2-amino-thiazoline-4-carboxylic acid hydrolase [Spirochaetota bacterium]